MKKILVVDGNSILNRAFYGVRPLTTKTGKNTNAVYGMLNMLEKQLSRLKPDYAAVAFDVHAPTFRHKMYDAYKAGRHPTPPELLEQFPEIKEILPMLGLHVLEMPGYEADDLQGTVASLAYQSEDAESYIFSGDRDLLQLIGDKITVLLAGNNDTIEMKCEQFFAKYGISPDQFVDMKALMGDSSDNIPGVSGIGEKTAATLLQTYGSLDGIYDAAENAPDDKRISKGVREKLLRDKENAYLSQKLAKIETAVPMPWSLDDLKRGEIDSIGLYRKFTELELSSFIRKFNLSAAAEPAGTPGSQSAPAPVSDSEKSIQFEASADDILALKGKKTALCRIGDTMAFSDGERDLLYRGNPADLAPLFDGTTEIVCYRGKDFYHALTAAGIPHAEDMPLLDLSLYAYVLNPGSGTPTLPSLISMFGGETVGEEELCPTAMLRTEAAMREKIRADGEEKILDGLELPLLSLLARIEERGFMVNADGLNEFGKALDELAKDLASRIYMQAGREFNLNSPKQLGDVLFVDLGLPVLGKKGKNGFSTDAETLEELRSYSPIIDDILEYRQVTKLNGTYAAVLPTVADAEHRVHTEFKQAVTATGRLSSADPNLQNIPIRTKMGREMRRYFVAKDGYALVDADYSQIELRLLAHISGDENMIEAFVSGEDIHRKTAAAVFRVPEEAVTDDLRKKAKAVNFGIVYGISGFSLAKDINTSVPMATKYIKSYLERYPKIGEYLERVVEEAKDLGYTVTPMGRRRYIPELRAQNGNLRAFGKRVAMNAPIQGAAADIMKLAMLRVDRRIREEGIDAAIVMQVHDELVVETKRSDVPRCKEILREEMENAVTLSLPLTVDVTEGENWLEQN